MEDFGIKPGMHFLAQAPFSFDLSVFSIYPALVSGGMLKPLNKSSCSRLSSIIRDIASPEVECVGFYSIIYGYLLDGTYIQWRKCAGIGHVFYFCGRIDEKNLQKVYLIDSQMHGYIILAVQQKLTVAISSIQIDQHVLDSYDRLPIGYVKKRHESFYCPRRQTYFKRGRNGVKSLCRTTSVS